MKFDTEMMRRHDGRGPRYTSYPTALQFSGDFTESDYRRIALASNEELIPRDLSLYFHLPFCKEACWYCGCHRAITRREDRKDSYMRRLRDAIALQAELFDRDRPVSQLHLGGGTPTAYAIDALGDLMDSVSEYFNLAAPEQREFAIEIDPRTVASEDISSLAGMGFNRISIGVQDFDERVQKAINRVQSAAQVDALTRAARRAGILSTSFDLIYGLPMQTPAGFSRTLDEVIAIGPDRLSIYAYAHLPERFPVQRLIPEAQLPDAETRLDLFALAVEKLTAAGYEHIGMDHFARAGDELVEARNQGRLHRNFQGYSTHPECDLVGIGASAISSIGDSHAQMDPDIARWEQAIAEGRIPIVRGIELNRDDVIRRDAIQSIMCRGRLDMAELERRHEIDFADYFGNSFTALNRYVEDGLITIDGRILEVTEAGRFLLRRVASVFDAYHQPSTKGRYSRVI